MAEKALRITQDCHAEGHVISILSFKILMLHKQAGLPYAKVADLRNDIRSLPSDLRVLTLSPIAWLWLGKPESLVPPDPNVRILSMLGDRH